MSSLLTLFFLVIFSLGCSSFSIHGQGKFDISSDDVKAHIVNGSKTDITKVPWQVALRGRGRNGSFCGGSIIDKHWVVTAGHCMVEKDKETGKWKLKDAADYFVVTGASHLIRSPGMVDVPIEEIFVHPEYNKDRHDHDIALIKTNMDLTTGNEFVKPQIIKLATQKDVYDMMPAIVSGYGILRFRGPSTFNLYSTKVRIIPDETCEKSFNSHYVAGNMICAGDIDNGYTTGVCMGDSGGPLVVIDQLGERYLAGVTSFGEKCADGENPGVWTSVPYYLKWIKATMKKNRLV